MEHLKKVHEPGDCLDRGYGQDCEGLAEWCENPYVQEIYNESEWEWICPGVYHGMCMDI